MLTISPRDFESTNGRTRIIATLHSMDAKLHTLERTVRKLSNLEMETEQDIQDLLRNEDLRPEQSY